MQWQHLKFKPNGTDLKLVAGDLRNPYEIAFTNDRKNSNKLLITDNGAKRTKK